MVTPATAGQRCRSHSGFHISKSLAEECETVGEVRPPRRVARISGFHRRCDVSVFLKLHWNRGSTIVCVRLEGDSPMVEEFGLPLRSAAGHGI